MPVLVEICVGDLASALAAGEGGADRVELCDNLAVGGTTPSAGTIAEACERTSIPVHVLIRPRAGDFLPGEAELSAMRRDIAIARSLGASGVVLGVLCPDGSVNRETTAELVALARPLSVTFHKAFDQTPDHDEALETLIDLGVDRVLTSGGRPTAMEGIDTLARLVARAADRITILAAGRLSHDNLPPILARTGAPEVHLGSAAYQTIRSVTLARTGAREIHLGSAAYQTIRSAMGRTPVDGSELDWTGVDAERVQRIVQTVRAWRGGKRPTH